MIYPKTFETKTEFDKIRHMLHEYCSSPLGQAAVDEMNFIHNHNSVAHLLKITDEFITILKEEDTFPLAYIIDVREALQRIKPEGTWMDEENLLGLQKSLFTIEKLVTFFKAKKEEYPVNFEIAQNVPLFGFLAKEIAHIFDANGEIKDNASVDLKAIRDKKRTVQGSINRDIERLLRRAKKEGLVQLDTTPSVRDGRLVIPVEARNKRKLNGIIHDESATGKTSYIEPAEVVEAHNKLKVLDNEERREIIKILIRLTNAIRPHVTEILESFNFLGFVDFNRAKARLAKTINGICPKLIKSPIIEWGKAIHPVLFLHHKKEGKPVVPLHISLNSENRILVISGPNAGGKSVCLKTVGLLQYMVQCGLPIPVDEASKVGVFQRIFIDIGDEQSIDNDLSTYSSHLENMKYFLKNANEHTLLLVDEFGTGTEPKLGGAIAESILNHLNQAKVFGVVNTHYGNIKHFATDAPGIINGAMLFDTHSMQPLYTLRIGKPGSSYAIEISRKIGLPESVIKEASDKIGADHFNYDKHLREITRDKKYWEEKRENIRKKNKQLSQMVETLEAEKEALIKSRKEILDKAKEEASQLYSKANASIENTIRQIKETKADKEATQKAREALEKQKKTIEKQSNTARPISKKAHHIIQKQKKTHVSKKEVSRNFTNNVIAEGDLVRLEGQSNTGEVISLKGKEAEVAFGNIKSKISLKRLIKVSNRQLKKERQITVSNPFLSKDLQEKKQNFKHDIDLRGQRADMALQKTTEFLDDAVMMGAKQLRILHGTGTGALRMTIRQYLGTLPYVASFNDEKIDLGGAGITVVILDI